MTDPALDPFRGLQVPEVFQLSLNRHRDSLAELVRALQTAEVDAAQIEASVVVIVESYKAELLRAVRTMRENGYV